MTEIEARAVDWSDLAVIELPTGTVTLLLADVEGSTGLWQTHAEEMTAAVARLDRVVSQAVAAHGGVQPVEQGEGGSFVVAFTRASDAVACAVEIQRAQLAPIRLRIGVHTGEVQLRDEGNYIGPTIGRTARLRDLAHGGQTVVSGTTGDLVADRLSVDTWLIDLGIHALRGLPRPERVSQLCHSDLRNDFPPLRTPISVVSQHLPAQLTSFVGRRSEIADVRRLLAEHRLVTLIGAGGAGKTRLAVQVAAEMAGDLGADAWFVDLAPVTDPDNVAAAMARALGLPDQPGRSTLDTLTRFIGGRQVLVVLDNCEHLLDASATVAIALLAACPALTVVATSREPIGVAEEVTWRIPSLSLDDEAIALFADRARRARPDFAITDDLAPAVTEICQRLDGMPLAIELAAARVRALTVSEILDSLHDRFRLLTGGSRSAVRRHQTLRASVDWSHALLTEGERIFFRRLGVFVAGFDLDAARAVGGSGDAERYEVLDLLTSLVDKSLVLAEETRGRTRYRMLETVRQYSLQKLGESSEANAIHTRQRDHYTAMADRLDIPGSAGHQDRIEQAEIEIDNLRAAFAWSHENSDVVLALQLASSLQPLWLTRGRIREGLAWFDASLTAGSADHLDVPPTVRARALADKAALVVWIGASDNFDLAEQAVAIARDVGDLALLAQALTACISVAAYNFGVARPYFAEAVDLARALGDRWRLGQILGGQAMAAVLGAGDPIAVRVAAEEGRDIAEAIGDGFVSRQCRFCLSWAQFVEGDLVGAVAGFEEVVRDADDAHDVVWWAIGLFSQSMALAHHGDTTAARAAANAAIAAAAELSGAVEGFGLGALALAALAEGDVAEANEASEAAWRKLNVEPDRSQIRAYLIAEVALARGDYEAAQRWAAQSTASTAGYHRMVALTTRARVAVVGWNPEQAERDAHEALACAADIQAQTGVPGILECVAGLAGDTGSYRQAARLFGAAEGIRQRTGEIRFQVHQCSYDAAVSAVRDAMGNNDFDAACAEGAMLSIVEAIAYAQRGRGGRKRPTSGWGSLTPTERDVVRLVLEGLANKDIAKRLFVSPRTVQTHLTHVYTKLGLTSRTQLAQEAARHAQRASPAT